MRYGVLAALVAACSLQALATPAPQREAPAGKSFTDRSIDVVALVKGSPEQIFEAWTTSAGADRFFGTESVIELREQGPYEIYFLPRDHPESLPNSSHGARVLGFERPHRLLFEWTAPPFASELNTRPLPQWVEVDIEADRELAGYSMVRLRHHGLGRGEKWDRTFEFFYRAWPQILYRLDRYLTAAGSRGRLAPMTRELSPEEVQQYFAEQGKTVLTFTGYSGAGYEDLEAMLARARQVLSAHDPASTIVNIGATVVGIGAVYELAKELGFATTGIVSTQAREYDAELSPFVDAVFFVPDEHWGGLVKETGRLSPTSRAMVAVSDLLVGIGGGAVSRDELRAAREQGIPVRFYPADLDHARAIEKAREKGDPPPASFKGEAHEAFGRRLPSDGSRT